MSEGRRKERLLDKSATKGYSPKINGKFMENGASQ
jgi:hypothetical protein